MTAGGNTYLEKNRTKIDVTKFRQTFAWIHPDFDMGCVTKQIHLFVCIPGEDTEN
jgi:hypothetical protein